MLNADDYVNENGCLLLASISAERKHQGLMLHPFIRKDGLFDVSALLVTPSIVARGAERQGHA